MITTLCKRLNMMHLLCLDEPAFPLAPLTKRVCIHVPVTDAFPCPAVLFVPLILQLLMLLTKPAVRQLGTAGVRTGALWLCGHHSTSFRA